MQGVAGPAGRGLTADELQRVMTQVIDISKSGEKHKKGEPAILLHHVALISNHGIVQIIHCRWRCCAVNYTTSPIIVIVYDVSIVIVYDVSISKLFG